eukprot:gene39679-5277_t
MQRVAAPRPPAEGTAPTAAIHVPADNAPPGAAEAARQPSAQPPQLLLPQVSQMLRPQPSGQPQVSQMLRPQPSGQPQR